MNGGPVWSQLLSLACCLSNLPHPPPWLPISSLSFSYLSAMQVPFLLGSVTLWRLLKKIKIHEILVNGNQQWRPKAAHLQRKACTPCLIFALEKESKLQTCGPAGSAPPREADTRGVGPAGCSAPSLADRAQEIAAGELGQRRGQVCKHGGAV